MSEETTFWGIASPGYGEGGRPESVLLPGWRLIGPDSRPIPFYPVFSSKDSAATFVVEHGDKLMTESPQLVEDLLEGIRLIKRSEIPPEHYVLSDHRGLLVKWSVLLGGEGPHEGYPDKPPSW